MHLGRSAINETDAAKEQQFNVEQLVIHAGFDNYRQDYENDIGMCLCVWVYVSH